MANNSSKNGNNRARVLHDLKNPITALKLKLQLAVRLLGSQAGKDPKIQKAADVLSNVNDDLDHYVEMLEKAFKSPKP